MHPLTLLDGPVGTELAARGVPTPSPLWSAWALLHAPEAVSAIHRDYARAGATVHTANTFRTRRRSAPERWRALTTLAVQLAREAVPAGQRVAGSLAPLEDCYEPWKSPEDPRPEHREMARALAEAGCDLLLCETFPHVGEGLIAVEEAAATGLPVWASFTAGHAADLLTPAELGEAAREAVQRGAEAVLVNCVPASRSLAYLERLVDLGVPFGAYANAGQPEEGMGWAPLPDAPERYLRHAERWRAAGASLIGGCCGTGPAHIAALRRLS
ncbi:MAG: homocysteine S-methyltransferase family protein [Alphaproteobacteria bacterium]|nr:homocysteine S-methyltransferase family protein [Alphaproteobacteria bacterium]